MPLRSSAGPGPRLRLVGGPPACLCKTAVQQLHSMLLLLVLLAAVPLAACSVFCCSAAGSKRAAAATCSSLAPQASLSVGDRHL